MVLKIFILIAIIFFAICFCKFQDYIFEKFDAEEANDIIIFVAILPIILFILYLAL